MEFLLISNIVAHLGGRMFLRQVIRPVTVRLGSDLRVASSGRCPCLVLGQHEVAAPCKLIEGALFVDQEVQTSWLPRGYLSHGSLDAHL